MLCKVHSFTQICFDSTQATKGWDPGGFDPIIRNVHRSDQVGLVTGVGTPNFVKLMDLILMA